MKQVFLALAAVLVSLCLCEPVLADDDAPKQDDSTKQIVIDASDKEAISANMGNKVVIKGEIVSAKWSNSGKVMNIRFKGTEKSRLAAVIFERHREAMDKAYAGDVGKALTGAKVRIEGELAEYGGKVEALKGTPQIIISQVTQITIVEAAPTTQPAD